MPHPVFISYARDASRDHAVALQKILGEDQAFLDTSGIEIGDRFPATLVDALFAAKVVVIFAEPVYFTRWYCLLEFRIARTPFLRVMDRAGSTGPEREEALRSMVIAFPAAGVSPEMQRFPTLVGATQWPSVEKPEEIAAMVLDRLAQNPPTLRERYAALGDADGARSMLLEATKVPPPMRIGTVPFFPQVGLATTLGEAFVGRGDDLWRIHDALTTERGVLSTAAGLTGSIEAGGGFGKTRLALEYLYRFGPKYFRGGLFWIDAEGDPEAQLHEVLRSLHPSAPALDVLRAAQGGVPGAVARAIRARPETDPSPLFILDNIPEPQPGEPPRSLETWCPVLGEVPVLTTSRIHVAMSGVGNFVALPIETLEPEAAVTLLTTGVSRTQLQPAEWDEIAAWVGYLPLALELLNRLLRFGELTAYSLLGKARDLRPSAELDSAMEILRGQVQPGTLRGVTEALRASYERLSPEEQRAARLLAWLAPEPVPEFLMTAFDADVFPRGVRATLRNRSLISEVRTGDGQYFGAMHRVLADFLRSQSLEPASEVAEIFAV
ncbi:MAG TPA: toll/interleukin-1 receptor domain-containing protein, partial [Longimicrobium sp.]